MYRYALGAWRCGSGGFFDSIAVMTESGWQLAAGSFEEKFIRSGGHGGQNVNKVATTVQLRFLWIVLLKGIMS